MVTLHILQYLLENGFGTAIDTDLFFEKLPAGKTGLAVYSRGGEMKAGRKTFRKRFDVYSRGTSDLTGANTLELVREFLASDYDGLCELPTIEGLSNRVYSNARFDRIGDVENIGLDGEDRVVFRLEGEILYEKL
jgi:hypothetical protein